MFIGVTGYLCSGKEETVKIIARKYGFVPLSVGNEVRGEATERGIEHTRPNLQALGDIRRIECGGDYWIDKILRKTSRDVNYVLEGIRNPEEVVRLRKAPGFYLLGIDASYEVRLARAMAKRRGRKEDEITAEQFAIDDRNDRAGESGKGQQSQKCFEQADYYIDNNSNELGYLESRIDYVFGTLSISALS